MQHQNLSSPTFDELTAQTWQKRSQRTLHEEDLRQIQENITGFIDVLQQWSNGENNAA